MHGKDSRRDAGVTMMECRLQPSTFSMVSLLAWSHLPQGSPVDGLGEIIGDFFRQVELLHLKLRCLLKDDLPREVELSQPTSSVGSGKHNKGLCHFARDLVAPETCQVKSLDVSYTLFFGKSEEENIQ